LFLVAMPCFAGERIIVEFTSPPRARTPVSLRSSAQSAPPFERFRADLKRIRTPETASGEVAAAAETADLEQEYSRAFSGAALTVTPAQRVAIEKLPYVLRVHPDLPVTAFDVEPGVAAIAADEVWRRLGSRGAGITVAVLDTGVDYGHPALGGGFGAGFKVTGGRDFVNKDDDPMDDHGHGTHVAGIVAANSAELTGVAPDASLIAYKVLNNQGTGWSSDILAAIEWTVDPNRDGDFSDRVDVANMSLGSAGHADDALSRAVDNAVSAGVVFVVATGNSGGFQSVSSPATADKAISVGAVDAHGALPSFTSKGPVAPRYGIKPDVVAPGVDVRSAKPGGGMLGATGTSMAAPHVAGAAALLRALHPEWTPAEVKSALVTTAVAVSADAMTAGAGRIDAFRAATITTRMLPEQLAFGIIDGNAEVWTGTRKTTITNRGTAAQTYEVSAAGARDGIELGVTPATVTLAPGESAEVALTVTVRNALVPYAAAGSLAYSGSVEVRSASDTLRVPWAIVKAARMRVSYADEEANARVFLGGPSGTPTLLPSLGRNLFEMLLPPARYSVVVVTFAEVNPYRETTMVIRDEFVGGGERVLELSPADAPYRLTFAADDETGRSLRDAETGVECIPFRHLQYETQSSGSNGLDLLYSTGTWRVVTAYPPHIRTSAIPDGYTVFGGDICGNAERTKIYALEYPTIVGVSGDVTRHAGGAALHGRQMRLLLPPTTDGRRSLGFTGRFMHWATAAHVPGLYLDWPSPEWNGTMFLSRNTDPDLALQAEVEVDTDHGWMRTHPLRVIDGGVASFSSWTPSPTTFVATPADPLEFGLGPATPHLVFAGGGNSALAQAYFTGPLDEAVGTTTPPWFRLFDREGTEPRQEGEAQLTVDDLSRPARLEIEAFPGQGPPELGARTLLSARFGGPQADRLPPTLTSAAVLNARSQPANRLGHGETARLRFSAIDAAQDAAPGRVKLDATKAWIRPTGGAQWIALPVAVRDEDFVDPNVAAREPVGTIFESSLSAIANEEGLFDLRITVEDASGNATETTFIAVFEVAPSQARRRSVRH
jgi:subtilisin family serine protease